MNAGDADEPDSKLPAPSFRATIRTGGISLTDWAPGLVGGEFPEESLDQPQPSEVTLVDLTPVGDDDDELVVVEVLAASLGSGVSAATSRAAGPIFGAARLPRHAAATSFRAR